MKQYDLCVIGSGPSGQKAAIQAAKLGKSVCVVEKREVLGGVTVNTGTIPSKALREAILDLGGRCVASPSEADFQSARNQTYTGLLGSCQRVIQSEISMVERHLSSNGIEVFYGIAQFRDAKSVEVIGENGGVMIHADHFLIAVGTIPARPENIPFDGVNLITSDEILCMPRLPHSLIVVGGGVIGTEYASMFSALGVKVSLVEGRARLLDFVDSELTEALQYHLRKGGMTLRLGEKVTKLEVIDAIEGARTADKTMAQATLESGKTLRADTLLYCIGRHGATAALNLSAAGLEADNRGRIKVEEGYRTSVDHIYACGDVIGFPALASTSMEQGRIAACQMFGQKAHTVREQLPYGIYAIPEISMVGWTEEKLTAESIPYESGIAQYEEIARGQLLGDSIGMLKLLIHQESRQILGVHVIGTGATELVHIGQTAMAFGGTVDYFADTVFNYPTLAECYKVAALNGINKLKGV